MYYRKELFHYNHNHDALGRFAVSNSGQSGKGQTKKIAAGQSVYRISARPDSFGGTVAYGSISESENYKWGKELTLKKYSQKYTAVSDIKVADETTVGKIYAKSLLKTSEGRKLVREALYDSENSYDALNKKAHDYFEAHPDKSSFEYVENGKPHAVYLNCSITEAKAATSLYALNPDSKAAKILSDSLKKSGYTALSDVRGYNVADEPIIFLDKSRLKLTESKRIVGQYDLNKEKYSGLGVFDKKGRKERDRLISERRYYTDYKRY